MITTTIKCDAPDCVKTEQILVGAGRGNGHGITTTTVPTNWISLDVLQPKRSWPFGTGPRHFCDWQCVRRWAEVLGNTDGEGPSVVRDPVSGWRQDVPGYTVTTTGAGIGGGRSRVSRIGGVGDVVNACGMPAVGGPCVLLRGHNMGRVDIPNNHQAFHRPAVSDGSNDSDGTVT